MYSHILSSCWNLFAFSSIWHHLHHGDSDLLLSVTGDALLSITVLSWSMSFLMSSNPFNLFSLFLMLCHSFHSHTALHLCCSFHFYEVQILLFWLLGTYRFVFCLYIISFFHFICFSPSLQSTDLPRLSTCSSVLLTNFTRAQQWLFLLSSAVVVFLSLLCFQIKAFWLALFLVICRSHSCSIKAPYSLGLVNPTDTSNWYAVACYICSLWPKREEKKRFAPLHLNWQYILLSVFFKLKKHIAFEICIWGFSLKKMQASGLCQQRGTSVINILGCKSLFCFQCFIACYLPPTLPICPTVTSASSKLDVFVMVFYCLLC